MLAYLALSVPVARDTTQKAGSVNAPQCLKPELGEAPSTSSQIT